MLRISAPSIATRALAQLGTLVAITTTFATASFKEAFGIAAAVWEALFIFGGVFSVAWFIIAIVRAALYGQMHAREHVLNQLLAEKAGTVRSTRVGRGKLGWLKSFRSSDPK